MSYVPYQIDYQTKGAGKTLGITKKKVTWKFGFANSEALAGGFSGSQCRGSEHEINFVWSLATGKRQIIVDQKEAHYSETGLNGWTSDRTFQHHFNLYSPNYGTVRCHLITLPPNHDAPGGNKPFQLKINGVNFFDLCKVFQLGTPAMIVRPAPQAGRGGRSGGDGASPEERQAIARAKLESMRDLRRVQENPTNASSLPAAVPTESALISFNDPVPAQQSAHKSNFMSSVTLDPSLNSPNSNDNRFFPASNNAAPYSNYSLPPSQTAPAYSNYTLPPAPAAQQYQQYQNGAPQYGQPPAPTSQAPVQYATMQAAPTNQPNHGYPPTGPNFNATAMSQGTPQQLTISTNMPSNTTYASSTPHSQASYGSAPSFAQPPRQQQSGRDGY